MFYLVMTVDQFASHGRRIGHGGPDDLAYL
jgi:hypothetical protein